MPALPFNRSSSPGRRAGEGQGRYINAFTVVDGEQVLVRRAPGIEAWASVSSPVRGGIEVNGFIYAATTDTAVKINVATGAVTSIGTIPGTDTVTWARNNRTNGSTSAPDIVAVRSSGGAFHVNRTTGLVVAYPDADLPTTVTSVTSVNGYFLFSTPSGLLYASQLNSTDQAALSAATAESKPDGLQRVIERGGILYAMGTSTIEPWRDAGAIPFPLVRVPSVIGTGLLTLAAVAGFEEGWEHNPIFVGHDGTVQELAGYDTKKVSTPAVEYFIAQSTTSTLEAMVFTSRGHSFWALSSDIGTWVYDITQQAWHERTSNSLTRWRATRSVKAGGRWVVGDTQGIGIGRISDTLVTEYGAAITWTVESMPLKDYPLRMAIPALFGEFTKAASTSTAVSWSRDGGESYAPAVAHALDRADKAPIRINRLGLMTHHGLRARFAVTSANDFAFMGAFVADPEGRTP